MFDIGDWAMLVGLGSSISKPCHLVQPHKIPAGQASRLTASRTRPTENTLSSKKVIIFSHFNYFNDTMCSVRSYLPLLV
ncbi:hypothetical protein AAKU55_005180 [Oxalobacteraceae bacterium GrIS 1.11]